DPGIYRVDAAVYDSFGQKASVVSRVLVVPPIAPTMVGDLLLIDHAERMTPEQIASSRNPLISDGLLIKPAASPRVAKRERSDLAFALPVLVAPHSATPEAKLTLISSEGEALASIALSLGTADAEGRVLAIGHVPLGNVPAGRYELEVTVGRDGEA